MRNIEPKPFAADKNVVIRWRHDENDSARFQGIVHKLNQFKPVVCREVLDEVARHDTIKSAGVLAEKIEDILLNRLKSSLAASRYTVIEVVDADSFASGLLQEIEKDPGAAAKVCYRSTGRKVVNKPALDRPNSFIRGHEMTGVEITCSHDHDGVI